MRISKRKGNEIAGAIDETAFAVKMRKRAPYEFVLDALEMASP